MTTKKVLVFITSLLTFSLCFGSIFDNRYFPFLQRPYLKRGCRFSQGTLGFNFMSAEDAYGDNSDKISIFDLHGKFDLNQLADAFVAAGRTDTLAPAFPALRGQKMIYETPGTLKAQTINLSYDQDLWCGFSVGFLWHFMHVTSCNEFELDKSFAAKLADGDEESLDTIRRSMLDEIGIVGTSFDQSALSDIDLYIRFGRTYDHPFSQRLRPFKFRRIDMGLRFGLLIPSGHKRDINNPGAAPFGGDGRLGFYLGFDTEFEVREDLHVGFISRVSKRISRIDTRRMPAIGEPSLYGVIVGRAKVDPGVSVIFSPYFSLENLRAGLGLRAQYTLVFHEKDWWIDRRPSADKLALSADLKKVRELSEWTSEYVTLSAFYDFAQGDECARIAPVLAFNWDYPMNYFVGSSFSKTHSVSLNLAIHF